MADTEHDLEPTQVVRTAWFFYLLLGLAGIVWIGTREGVIPLSLFVDLRTWWLDLGLGVGAGLLLLATWNLGVRRLASARDLEERLGGLLGRLTVDEAVALAILSGVAEELFFRGAVQGSWGFLWATVLFGLLHSGPGRVFGLWTLFALVAGALFGGLVLWRGNLTAAVIAHVLVNAVNLRRIAAASGDGDDGGDRDGAGGGTGEAGGGTGEAGGGEGGPPPNHHPGGGAPGPPAARSVHGHLASRWIGRSPGAGGGEVEPTLPPTR